MEKIGSYRIESEVARGPAGVVYRAQAPDGERVALKVGLERHARDRAAVKRFRAAVDRLTTLRHPNVVTVLDAGVDLGKPWIALEFVAGQSLAARLRGGPLPVWESVRVAQHLAQALAYVHANGIVHGDLKPSNVLCRGDQVLLNDFAIAPDDASRDEHGGTPGYWPPEHVLGGSASLGPSSDVYGLGAVLYTCLTGRPPVSAETLEEHLVALRVQPTLPPGRLRSEVPAWLDDVCMRCLDRDPNRRPANAEAVAQALTLTQRIADPPGLRRRGIAAVSRRLGAIFGRLKR